MTEPPENVTLDWLGGYVTARRSARAAHRYGHADPAHHSNRPYVDAVREDIRSLMVAERRPAPPH
jgi:hypothetical protein